MNRSPHQSPQGALSDRTCLQCQRRKTKCIGGAPGRACLYCAKSGKACIAPKRATRTPLTRKNLDEAEARCERLEALLQSVSSSRAESDTVANDVAPGVGHEDAENLSSLTPGVSGIREAPSRNPPVQETAYGWDESPRNDQGRRSPGADREPDGMASLDDVGEHNGYLGESSGYRILESVSKSLPSQPYAHLSDASRARYPRPDIDQTAHGGVETHWSPLLSSTYIQDQLISTYFTYYNSSYPILHERTFREQCSARHQVANHKSWHIIYYMVLAIGEWTGGHSNDKTSIYYELARSHFKIEILESGNIQNVQAFLLLGNYLQKRDRPNTGFNLIGMAYRMAIGLGLHREPQQSSQVDNFAMHRRRVLFWVLYCFDSGFNITTGRPILMSDSFIDVRIPENIDEAQHAYSSGAPTEVAYPTVCSAIIAQARLARIANKIYERFMSVDPCRDAEYQTSVMEQMIQNWRSSLPAYFEATDVPTWFFCSRQVLFWREANLRIILLIASEKLHRDAHEKLAIGRRYQSIAVQTISDICHFCNQNQALIHRGFSWYIVYFILQASLALSVYEIARGNNNAISHSEDQHRMQAYDDIIIQAQQCLRALSRFDRAAARSLRVLSRLHANLQKSSVNSQTHSNNTPATILSNETYTPAGGASLNRRENMMNSPQQPVDQNDHQSNVVLPGASIEAENDTNPIFSNWNVSIDPAFHLFFDNSGSINDLFEGVSGFPSTAEPDDFDYYTNTMLRM